MYAEVLARAFTAAFGEVIPSISSPLADRMDLGVRLSCPECPSSFASEALLQDHVDADHLDLVPLSRLARLFHQLRDALLEYSTRAQNADVADVDALPEALSKRATLTEG